jgi:hypothetical protein
MEKWSINRLCYRNKNNGNNVGRSWLVVYVGVYSSSLTGDNLRVSMQSVNHDDFTGVRRRYICKYDRSCASNISVMIRVVGVLCYLLKAFTIVVTDRQTRV